MTMTSGVGRNRSRRSNQQSTREQGNGRSGNRTRSRTRGPLAGTHEYPRPQLVRQEWTSLNGVWQFAFDRDAVATSPGQVDWSENRQILVPFAPETPLSGINDISYTNACWYRRTFESPPLTGDQRLILHFGAVDYEAKVWVNDHLIGEHEGGYTPFDMDITDALVDGGGGEQTIIVCARDDPHDLSKPRGKQDWKPEPHSIWYPRTTGIWQTVWLERVNWAHISSIRWRSNVRKWEVGLHVRFDGADKQPHRLIVRLRKGDRVLAEDNYQVTGGEVVRTITLNDPGIDDARNELMWWPWEPNLIEADLRLLDASGKTIDEVASYTAMRSVDILGDRFLMNGRPLHLHLVLDQGYWEESGLTAPSDDALRRDVELVKALGFNGVRKHQKIEDPRFLYWADHLGLLVWEEMPSAYRFDDRSVQRLAREWAAAIKRDLSHPCIIAWVPLNESWGVPDLPHSEVQRDFVRSMYYLTRSLDSSRPIIGNDGWENIVTDIIAIHDYDGDAARVAARYDRSSENLFKLFTHERPGHKVLLLDEMKWDGIPVMLTEFGGIAFHKDQAHTWGYRRAGTAKQFEQMYGELLKVVRTLPLFAGFCYTQFTDTYQEANGLLYMNRTPKLPIEQLRRLTTGG